MVTKACILEVLHNKRQHLQRFYVTDLGFDRVLLGYLWLSTFSPQIDWKTGQVEGKVTLKTVASVWVRWKELRKAALVAEIQVNQVEVEEKERRDEEWEVMVAKTNFAQDWAREANKNKQEEGGNLTLPSKYERHARIFDENAAKHFPPSQPEDHAIRLKPGAPSEINCKVYPLTKQEMEATREFLDKNLALGYIEECDKGGSPWFTPWFFTGKKDGELRPLQDYRIINSWTV
jgi:hypothetical protein